MNSAVIEKERSETPSSRSDKTWVRRAIWRWHFWAGLIAGPVLIVASITGAIYIFQPELTQLLYPHLMQSVGEGEVSSLASEVQAAQQEAGSEWTATVLEINNLRGGSHAVFLTNESHDHRRIYIDPVGAAVLGERPKQDFLTIVLAIHRRLFVGTFGRVLVEFTTSWTILLLVTGIYLWWPKSFRKLGGVFLPRLRGKRYVVARDLHSVPGMFLMPIGVVIAVTGLLYSLAWGSTFLLTGFASGSFDIEVNPPKSVVPAEAEVAATKLNVDDVMQLAMANDMPLGRISIEIPTQEDGAFAFKSGDRYGPWVSAVLFVDQYSGEIIQMSRLSELPWMAQWTQWNYPLHVGSVLGWTTKFIWLVACVILVALPLTGLWMWLVRRKKGTLSAPKKYDEPLPRWVWTVIILSGIFLPIAGISMVIVGLTERVRTRRAATRESSDALS